MVVVAGGYGEEGLLTSTEILRGPDWEEVASLPYSAHGLVMVNLAGRLFLAAGQDSNNNYRASQSHPLYNEFRAAAYICVQMYRSGTRGACAGCGRASWGRPASAPRPPRSTSPSSASPARHRLHWAAVRLCSIVQPTTRIY